MPGKKVREHLDQSNIKYVTISHSPAYTAHDVAESAHIAGEEMAKTVVVMVEEKPVMVVVTAANRVDMGRVKEITGASNVRLATEPEFRDLFPGCELGGMPPFGSLYGMAVYVSNRLAENDQIAFNAGSHSELIRLAYADYVALEQPQLVEI